MQGDWNRLTNRIRRLLETSSVKLASAMSSSTSRTGQLILHAIASDKSDREKLVELAQGRLKQKKAALKQALPQHYSTHFRWLLSELLNELSGLDTRLTNTEVRIREAMTPHQDQIRRLCTIRRGNEVTAWALIAELGTDMSRFPTGGHCAS